MAAATVIIFMNSKRSNGKYLFYEIFLIDHTPFCFRRLVVLKFLQDFFEVITHDQGFSKTWLGKTFVRGHLNEFKQIIIKAIDIEKSTRFFMNTELCPGPLLKNFLKRSRPTRNGNKTIGEF